MLGKAFRQFLVGGVLCAAAAFSTMGSATAQTYTGVTPPNLGGATTPVVVAPAAPVRSVQVASAPVTRVATAPVDSLAFTGSDLVSMMALGGALLVLGLVMTRRTRAGPAPSSER